MPTANLNFVHDRSRFLLFVGAELAATAEIHRYDDTWTMRKDRVEPKFRGRGFQRELIRQRVSYVQSIPGAESVVAWVNPANSHSLKNYFAEGFRFAARDPREFDGILHGALERIFDR